MKTNFKVVGLVQLGIKPESTAPQADTLTIQPSELFLPLDLARKTITFPPKLLKFVFLKVPATTPTFVSPRPLEGRYARLYQQRRSISTDIRYPEENPASDPPDVMDEKMYSSLPGTPTSSRWKDEWYVTGRKSAEPVLQNNVSLERSFII